MLLGDVDELEEERERPQHRALPLGPERRDRVAESASRAARARVAGERADPLLVVEELLPLLLDEHAPEQVAEQAHVGARAVVSADSRRRHPRGRRGAADRLAEPVRHAREGRGVGLEEQATRLR